MAKIEREGVTVEYPDSMDYQTLEDILRSIVIQVAETHLEAPTKDPLPKVGFLETPFTKKQ
jgi:hypothetical protein